MLKLKYSLITVGKQTLLALGRFSELPIVELEEADCSPIKSGLKIA